MQLTRCLSAVAELLVQTRYISATTGRSDSGRDTVGLFVRKTDRPIIYKNVQTDRQNYKNQIKTYHALL